VKEIWGGHSTWLWLKEGYSKKITPVQKGGNRETEEDLSGHGARLRKWLTHLLGGFCSGAEECPLRRVPKEEKGKKGERKGGGGKCFDLGNDKNILPREGQEKGHLKLGGVATQPGVGPLDFLCSRKVNQGSGKREKGETLSQQEQKHWEKKWPNQNLFENV